MTIEHVAQAVDVWGVLVLFCALVAVGTFALASTYPVGGEA